MFKDYRITLRKLLGLVISTTITSISSVGDVQQPSRHVDEASNSAGLPNRPVHVHALGLGADRLRLSLKNENKQFSVGAHSCDKR